MTNLPPFSSLMSPPETKLHESFTSDPRPSTSPATSPQSSFNANNTLPPISEVSKHAGKDMESLPISPPISPWVVDNKKRKSDALEQSEEDDLHRTRDPILYPPSEAGTEPTTHEPLFIPHQLSSTADALVTKHMALHMHLFDHTKSGKTMLMKPTREEYLLALSCVPIVSRGYNRNPGAWALREREYLDRQFGQKRIRLQAPSPGSSKLKKLAPAPVKKPSTPVVRAPRAPRVRRTPKSTPKEKILDSFDFPVFSTPKPPRVIGVKRDDTDFESVPDYCPPLESLDGNVKGLKAEWKGNLKDLSNDPHRHLLHPAEVSLASLLRLECAQYLCSKRRIFEARLNALRIGKEFRKTDAQQACKIDVNKASRLWAAFEKVGWFKPEWLVKWV